jgi:hypothetical protein
VLRLVYLGVTKALSMLRLLPTSDRAKDGPTAAAGPRLTASRIPLRVPPTQAG